MVYYNYSNNYGSPVVCPYTQGAQYYDPDSLYPNQYNLTESYRSPDHLHMPVLPNSWKFGPIKIEWAFDGQSVNCVLKVLENAIKEIALTLSKPSISITTDFGEVQVNLKVNGDFVKNQVSISGSVCIETVCTIFNNTVIAKW